jgi:hypothetical protein
MSVALTRKNRPDGRWATSSGRFTIEKLRGGGYLVYDNQKLMRPAAFVRLWMARTAIDDRITREREEWLEARELLVADRRSPIERMVDEACGVAGSEEKK